MKSPSSKKNSFFVILLALAVLHSTACCKRQVVRVKTQSVSCLDKAPPALPEVAFAECEGWEGCLDFDNAGKLLAYLRHTQRWMRQAHLSCSEQPQEGENHERN